MERAPYPRGSVNCDGCGKNFPLSHNVYHDSATENDFCLDCKKKQEDE